MPGPGVPVPYMPGYMPEAGGPPLNWPAAEVVGAPPSTAGSGGAASVGTTIAVPAWFGFDVRKA